MKLKSYISVITFIVASFTTSSYAKLTLSNSQKIILTELLTGKNWRSVDSIYVVSATETESSINIVFNDNASTVLITTGKINQMTDSVKVWNKGNKSVSFKVGQNSLNTFLPKEWSIKSTSSAPLVNRHIDGNLYGRTFALWNSHGRYYEQSLGRWEWQRARLFTTVEDILTASFVLPYLAPMLENAGANVLLPKERDTQAKSITIDNSSKSFDSKGLKVQKTSNGYAPLNKIEGQNNPFLEGDASIYKLTTSDTLKFNFEIEKTGEYAVYTCYTQMQENCQNVNYLVNHAQGTTSYTVNQQKGGGMWVYLGTHLFEEGQKYDIEISGDGLVSVDAVKIGGGMGQVVREYETSGLPAWMECARYYLQSNGFGANIYSSSNGKNDYTDDINARGDWVNALKTEKNINIDAVLALHTDAGIANLDSIIGTLTIVSTKKNGTSYSNGLSKKIAHDLAQSIEQTIVNDIRATWCSNWSERGIWDKGYSESRRADAPSVLIELLSHQNINDIRYALHPQFRFDVCRSIYKGLLKFFNGKDAIVQPLPINHFGITQINDTTLELHWAPTIDSLESTALPDEYIVYANGQPIATTQNTNYTITQHNNGVTTNYQIVAKNKGGISFPSRLLSARLRQGAKRALLVEGFDRVSAPNIIKTDNWAGILSELEPGVAWGKDVFCCGYQYDFNPKNQWLDDDCPGWGASFANLEGVEQLGSRLNITSCTAKELTKEGYSFISVSKDYFEDNNISDTTKYDYVRITLGNQKSTWYGDMKPRHAIYNEMFLNKIEQIVKQGASMYITGANIGSDIEDVATSSRIAELLGFRFRTSFASRSRVIKMNDGRRITLPQTMNEEGFAPAPDAIEPATKDAQTIGRYEDTGMSAIIKFGNIIVGGF